MLSSTKGVLFDSKTTSTEQAWFTKNGLTKEDINDLTQLIKKLNKDADQGKIAKILEQQTEELDHGLYFYQGKAKLILECNPYAVTRNGDASSQSAFSIMFTHSFNWRGICTPQSAHLKKMWEKIEKDFVSAYRNNGTPEYFSNNGIFRCVITSKGEQAIKALIAYSLRHIVVFNVWLQACSDDNSHNNNVFANARKDWDSIFPSQFLALAENQKCIEKEILENQPIKMPDCKH